MVVEQQRHDPDQPAEDKSPSTLEDAQRCERVTAREQVYAEHQRREEDRVLGGAAVAERQPGHPQVPRVRWPLALVPQQRKRGKGQEGREHVAEDQRRERQRKRAKAKDHRSGGAIPRLQTLGQMPDEQQQQQPGKHVGPQPDQVDHLVAWMIGRRYVPVGPRFGAHPLQRVVERQRDRAPARARAPSTSGPCIQPCRRYSSDTGRSSSCPGPASGSGRSGRSDSRKSSGSWSRRRAPRAGSPRARVASW